MRWYPFDPAKGYRQKRPPLRKLVLVLQAPVAQGHPSNICVGYRKDAAGCKDSPYFVTPGVPGVPVAWCDGIPDDVAQLLWSAWRRQAVAGDRQLREDEDVDERATRLRALIAANPEAVAATEGSAAEDGKDG